jgi:hypothetical protein
MRLAGLDLVRLRIAVARRAAHEDVVDVDLLAGDPDLPEQARQQLPGGTDERHALLVLVEARRLADEHQVRSRRPRAEDDLRPPLGERALRAARDLVAVGEQLSSSHRILRNSRRRSWAVRRCRAPRTTC